MNRVEELIVQALTTAHNNQLRQQAEKTIFALLNDSPADFFLTCANIVVAEAKPEQIRQSAASVMKAVLAKRTENGEFFWDLVPPNVREHIKQLLLSNLVSPHVLVMRAGANVIAQVASIEIPRGEWLEIVASLADNSMHEEVNIRRASITTLGFICEELKNVQTEINRQTCEQILGSLLICLRETTDIVEIALAALRESVVFLRHILENEQYCGQVFEYVFPLMGTNYRNKVYEFLFEFGRHCYHMLGGYLGSIAAATVQHIDQRDEAAILALELWDTIGTEYLRRQKEATDQLYGSHGHLRNFVEELQDTLLSHVMAAILILSKEDLEFPELRESAVKTLTTFVSCGGRTLFDKVTDGVSRVLQSPNAGERQASALLFSCLVDFADRDYTLQCFGNGFTHLYQLIEDKEDIVRKNTLNGFSTLSECFPEVFLANSNIEHIFDHLLRLSSNSDEITQVLALSILINVSQQLKEYPQCPLISDPDKILQSLIAIFTGNITQGGNREGNEKVIGIIMNMVMATNKRTVIVMLLTHLGGLYSQCCNAKVRDQEIILGQILTIIHTTVLAMVKFPTDEPLRRKVYQLLDLHLSLHGVEMEGIHLIGAMALCFKRDFFNDRFDKYWGVVLQGLEMPEQKPTFKSALTCIQDISRNNQSRLLGKFTPVFHKLIEYMHSPIDRDIKTEILRCFGDLALGIKNYSQVFVGRILEICDECAAAVQKLSEMEAQREYAQELKEALIEMYHCVVFAMNEQNGTVNRSMADHFAIICTFIVKTCDVRHRPTVDYVKNCLYLIFDAALFYGRSRDHKKTVSDVLNSKEIASLITTLRNFKDRAGVGDVLAFIEDKLRSQRR